MPLALVDPHQTTSRVDRPGTVAIMALLCAWPPIRRFVAVPTVMRIELVNLEHGRADFAHVYQPEELGLQAAAPDADQDLNLVAPATVAGNIRRNGAEVFVSGHIETRAEVECDRCLQKIELPVSTDFSLEYIPGAEYESSEAAELTEDEMSISVF